MTPTIKLIKKCIASDNCVTRAVYKDIIANRMLCSSGFIQTTYLIGYGSHRQHERQ